MDQNNVQNGSGMMNGIPPVIKEEKKIGPLLVTLVIVLLLVVGALYVFGQNLNKNSEVVEDNKSTVVNTSPKVSTDQNDIEADLDAQLNNVDYSF